LLLCIQFKTVILRFAGFISMASSFQRPTSAIAVGQRYRMTVSIRNKASPNATEYQLPEVSGARVIGS
jgi:hypothetical protein